MGANGSKNPRFGANSPQRQVDKSWALMFYWDLTIGNETRRMKERINRAPEHGGEEGPLYLLCPASESFGAVFRNGADMGVFFIESVSDRCCNVFWAVGDPKLSILGQKLSVAIQINQKR
jgi:hypothetical protein